MSSKLNLWQKYMISKQLTGNKLLPYSKIKQMILREPHYTIMKKWHPSKKIRFNKTIEEPKPLKFSLHDYNPISINTPLQPKEDVTFKIIRTHTNNLPVYTDYKHHHEIKFTIIRNIIGNVNDLANEIKKITSNSDVEIKTGKIMVKGIHLEKIRNYLLRLGF